MQAASKVGMAAKSKTKFWVHLGIGSAWLDWLFPPLCEVCKTFCRTQILCPGCWELCSPIDPIGRCVHCFQPLDAEIVCTICRKDPKLPVPSAFVFEPTLAALKLCRKSRDNPEGIAGFLLFQWARLHWSIPDAILPFEGALPIARFMASWIGCPVLPYWETSPASIDALGESKVFLLVGIKHSADLIGKSISLLSGAFPKKIYALTLLHDDCNCYFDMGSDGRGDALLGDEYCPSATGLDCPAPGKI